MPTPKYGNYWNEDQIIAGGITDDEQIPFCMFRDGSAGAPGFVAGVFDKQTKHFIQYIFVEIVPGTEHDEYFLNGLTGQYEFGVCVEINIYNGHTFAFESMTHIGTDAWPLKWFRLDRVPTPPNDAHDAYARAMAIVG